MGRIQSNIGLITGMPIGDTVDQLMALAAKPRDMLAERTETLKAEQLAVTELSAYLLSVRYITDNLGKDDVFEQRAVSSSNEAVLSATVTGNPPIGLHQFTPLRTAQSQQLLTSGFRSDTEALGGGTLSFRFGDHVERGADLSRFDEGNGVVRGQIRITDRSGATAEIDLSTVQTVDDVLEAINSDVRLNLSAVATGDGIRLIDHTGQSISNLKVQEVSGGTTAASLGLDGIDVAASTADGRDMLGLYEDLELDLLNDGNGVFTSPVFADFTFQLRDGTTGEVDLSPIIPGSSVVDQEVTLGEIMEAINAAAPDKLRVDIAPDGERLVLTDFTEGAGAFTLADGVEPGALRDLGLDGSAVDGVITGRRIHGGVKTVLLGSLNGGRGLGTLGTLELTDRSGTSDTIDLSGAETLDDVIGAINAAGVAVTARINTARNGIELLDTSGAYAGNFIVANGDSSGTADKLQIATDEAATSVQSGDLHLKVISHNTLLRDLNGGAGMALGTISIQDSLGSTARVDLSSPSLSTIGDVIREINRSPLQIHAEINATGDGIRIIDSGGGSGKLQVTDVNSTTAADLHLLGEVTYQQVDGASTMVLDGSTTYTIELDDTDSLVDLRQKIDDLNAGVDASTFVDGSSKPFRLLLQSQQTGSAGGLVFDVSGVSFSLQETARARDALLVLGEAGTSSANVLIASSSNTFDEVLSGLSLRINQSSTSPVTISVAQSDTDLVANVRVMVTNYNKFRTRLNELTAYDELNDVRAILAGDGAALRLDTELSYLLSSRFTGAGSIQSLGELGISFTDTGTLTLDETKLKSQFAENPLGVKTFFTQENLGFSEKFNQLTEQLTNPDQSLLTQRFNTLRDKIERQEQRIEFLNAKLERERERLYLQFYQMELAIGKMQSSMWAIDSIQPMTPLASR
ncbi:MAG: flagellar filament capping protein FliD [Planctomycetes bacterium]|nr:flagellar filament capping protein FliD [Planctomycetota bacterium]